MKAQTTIEPHVSAMLSLWAERPIFHRLDCGTEQQWVTADDAGARDFSIVIHKNVDHNITIKPAAI